LFIALLLEVEFVSPGEMTPGAVAYSGSWRA
jgi:hypothetical protein